MGTSSQILTILRDSLELFMASPKVIFERYRQNLADIEERQDIPFARVGIYENIELVATKVDDRRSNMALTTYNIEISVLRAYENMGAEDCELLVWDLKDQVMAWAQTCQIAALTGAVLTYFSYQQHSGIIRNPRYATLALVFTAQRDMLKSPVAPIIPLPFP